MRKLSIPLIYILLVIAALAWGFIIMFIVQSAWLKNVEAKLTSTPFVGLPTSTTPISNFSIPPAPNPVSIGKESIVNEVGITVSRVINPANTYIGKAALPSVLGKDKQYLVVDIKVRCVSKSKICRVVEFDFGVETKKGQDYPAEFSTDYSDTLKGVFEGGDIRPGKIMSGSLIFAIPKGETGLTLIYPRLYGFGGEAKFNLGK
jgi:uncharacterized protein DUF4352